MCIYTGSLIYRWKIETQKDGVSWVRSLATVVATVVKSELKLRSSDSGQSSLWERASLSLERGNEIDRLKGLLKYSRAVRLCPFSGSRMDNSSLSPCMDGTSDGPLWVTLLTMAQAHEWPSVKNQQQLLLVGATWVPNPELGSSYTLSLNDNGET